MAYTPAAGVYAICESAVRVCSFVCIGDVHKDTTYFSPNVMSQSLSGDYQCIRGVDRRGP